ncbi:MAG: hypothetical protein AABW56_05535 [Nanoarchaeota archaeon]
MKIGETLDSEEKKLLLQGREDFLNKRLNLEGFILYTFVGDFDNTIEIRTKNIFGRAFAGKALANLYEVKDGNYSVKIIQG